MRDLIFAIGFLTRLPVPAITNPGPNAFAAAAKWFPLVGLMVGALLALCLSLGTRIDPWLGALCAVACWVWVTGGLHLDGLSDLADALGGAHRAPEHLLRIMHDPHIGSFGTTALWLVLSAKLVLLMLLAQAPNGAWCVLLIPAWARLGSVIWARTLPPLGSGLGERFGHVRYARAWLAWIPLLAALSWFANPFLLGAPLVLWVWWLFLKYRVGGMSGDCLGAGIEVSETLLLVAMVALTR